MTEPLDDPSRLLRTQPELDPDTRARLPEDPLAFLRELGASSFLRVPGSDRSRARAVTTLIHGNEPSGLRAIHAWLRGSARPATDVVFWIASVAAALGPPVFTHRALPGHRDLNRCFLGPEGGSAEHALARAALVELREAAPEALVDLHNTTGHSPAYAVAPRAGARERALAARFGRHLVHSDLRLGALVEAVRDDFPSVTVECGRAGDARADAIAFAGLTHFLAGEDAFPEPQGPLEVLTDPVRVEVREGVGIAIREAPASDAVLTVSTDLDRHNLERIEPGAALGWLPRTEAWPLVARDASGRDRSREFFEARGDRLVVRRTLVPIMMTTDPAIAKSDCLFYIVRPAQGTRSTGPA